MTCEGSKEAERHLWHVTNDRLCSWEWKKIQECCSYLVPAVRVRIHSIYNAAEIIPQHPGSHDSMSPGLKSIHVPEHMKCEEQRLQWEPDLIALCVIGKASQACLYSQHFHSCCTLSSLGMPKENLMEAKKNLSRFPPTVSVNCWSLFMFRVCVCVCYFNLGQKVLRMWKCTWTYVSKMFDV